MAVTATVYDINDRAWSLTINGNTPSTLNLTNDGIIIETPKWQFDTPVILPKYTFKFWGDRTFIEAFGYINDTSHSFQLKCTDLGIDCRGFLSNEIISIENTGYDEVIELNGISQLESLKYKSFSTDVEQLRPIKTTLENYINTLGVTGIDYDLAFGTSNLGYVSDTNFYDEEKVALNQLDILNEICKFYSLKLEVNIFNRCKIRSITSLQKYTGTLDYSTFKHRGINETYNRNERYNSAKIVDSILKPDDLIINLDIDNSAISEPPYLYCLTSGWRRHGNTWSGKLNERGRVNYEVHLHVFTETDFPGWTFPKYYNYGGVGGTMTPVAEWYDENVVLQFDLKQPMAGLYSVSYRAWEGGEPSVPLTHMLLLKAWHRENTPDSSIMNQINGTNTPVAIFNGMTSVTEEDYLLISCNLGYSGCWGEESMWEDHSMTFLDQWTNIINRYTVSQDIVDRYGIRGVNGKAGDVMVPLSNYLPEIGSANIQNQLFFSVKFKGKYWNNEQDDWVTSESWFSPKLTSDNAGSNNVSNSIADKYPPVVTPLYESLGRGYAVRFGKRQSGTGTSNIGNGELEFKIAFKDKRLNPLTWHAYTFWLQNFNLNLVNGKDASNLLSQTPQSPVYQFGDEKQKSYPTVTNYLMSKFEGITSFSQVYTDAQGDNLLDKLTFNCPVYNSTNFTVTEKPENHQLRLIKQLISDNVTLNDILSLDQLIQINDNIKYQNKLLVRQSYNIDCLNNLVNVEWQIKTNSYN